MERIPQSVAIRVTFDAYLAGTANPALGKTIVVKISKNGAAFANPAIGALDATEISDGSYFADLAAADVATLGPLILLGTEGTIDDVKFHARVVNPNTLGAAALPNVASGAAGAVLLTSTGQPVPTTGNQIAANVKAINNATVQGDGNATPWGPA